MGEGEVDPEEWTDSIRFAVKQLKILNNFTKNFNFRLDSFSKTPASSLFHTRNTFHKIFTHSAEKKQKCKSIRFKRKWSSRKRNISRLSTPKWLLWRAIQMGCCYGREVKIFQSNPSIKTVCTIPHTFQGGWSFFCWSCYDFLLLNYHRSTICCCWRCSITYTFLSLASARCVLEVAVELSSKFLGNIFNKILFKRIDTLKTQQRENKGRKHTINRFTLGWFFLFISILFFYY